jgi:hypothetical protein
VCVLFSIKIKSSKAKRSEGSLHSAWEAVCASGQVLVGWMEITGEIKHFSYVIPGVATRGPERAHMSHCKDKEMGCQEDGLLDQASTQPAPSLFIMQGGDST